MKIRNLLFGFLLGCWVNVAAQTYTPISLPSLFSDQMVLQQKSRVSVWGWGNASSTVRVVGSWATTDTVSAVVNALGEWKTQLPTTKAGGPYTLQIFTGNDKIVLNDVMLGEVWLCSGQSNMEWTPDNGLSDKEAAIEAADYPQIRFFSLPKRGALTPQNNCKANWELCTPEVMKKRSAVAYFFGKELQKQLNVPVGLIISAWGGTTAEVWTPADEVENDPVLAAHLPLKPYAWWPVIPGSLFNGMILPVLSYRFAGTIWYQGESNQDHAATYGKLMEKLITSWRKTAGFDFPFYMVQIAPHTYGSKDNGPALIRECQEYIAEHLEGCGMVTISDQVSDVRNIHPIDKKEVGGRLCRLALGRHYKSLTSGFETPVFHKITIKGSKAELSFRHVNKLMCKDKQIRGLQMAGEDGVFMPAEGKVKNNKLIVSASAVKTPVAVRYCFDDATIGNLFNEYGYPLSPFRTDRSW